MANCICSYNIISKELQRVVELDGNYINAVFNIGKEVYVIGWCNDSSNNTLHCLKNHNDTFVLEDILKFGHSKINIAHNWFIYYNTPLFQSATFIYAYDFYKKENITVTDDCEGYRMEGAFKPKLVSCQSDYMIIGEWLYYIKDIPNYDLSTRKQSVESHICRVNLNTPMKPVDLGSF